MNKQLTDCTETAIFPLFFHRTAAIGEGGLGNGSSTVAAAPSCTKDGRTGDDEGKP